MDGAPGDRLYYLVFWQDKTYDIVEDYRVKYNDDGTQLVEWYGKYYPARILRESQDLNWLTTLTVTTDGEVHFGADRKNLKNIAKKRDINAHTKKIDQLKKKTDHLLNTDILASHDIFERSKLHQQNSETITIKSLSSTTIEGLTSEADPKMVPESDENRVKKALHGNSTDKCSNSCPLRNLSPEVSKELLSVLKSIVQYIEKKEGIKVAEQLVKSDDISNDTSGDSDMVKLHPNHQVQILREKLFLITKRYKTDAREMTRQLLKAIIGDEKLSNMTLSGRGQTNDRSAVPEKVLAAVFEYVDSHVQRSAKKSQSELRLCVTNMCNGLRQKNKLKPVSNIKEEPADVGTYKPRSSTTCEDIILIEDEDDLSALPIRSDPSSLPGTSNDIRSVQLSPELETPVLDYREKRDSPVKFDSQSSERKSTTFENEEKRKKMMQNEDQSKIGTDNNSRKDREEKKKKDLKEDFRGHRNKEKEESLRREKYRDTERRRARERERRNRTRSRSRGSRGHRDYK